MERTVHNEIANVRLDAVCAMLAETNLTIGDIVRKTGFSSLSYLCSLFLQKFGCTMRTYRQACKFGSHSSRS